MDDIEKQIQAAGAGDAPRVRPEDVEAAIASEHYFTAAQGASRAAYDEMLDQGGVINSQQAAPLPDALSLLTFCVLVLKNGYTVTGESAVISKANFNAQIGRDVARKAAVAKIWPLLGFRLVDYLYAQAQEVEWERNAAARG